MESSSVVTDFMDTLNLDSNILPTASFFPKLNNESDLYSGFDFSNPLNLA